MNTDDIKISETYNLRVEVLGKNEDFIHTRPIAPNGEYRSTGFLEILHKYAPSFAPISSEPGTSVPPPKHDPCRLFKKGDVVEPKQVKGRVYSKDSKHLISKKCIVFRDEEEPGYVVISYAGKNYSINAAYLELVTPVEELEPYTVDECGFAPTLYVRKNGKVYMTIPYKEGSSLFQTREEALAAAEAECARLNEEWRKEHQ